ncbi:unnamed protein product, partial [Effrenium voratum]
GSRFPRVPTLDAKTSRPASAAGSGAESASAAAMAEAERWMSLVARHADPTLCATLNQRWRVSALLDCRRLKLRSGCPLQVLLGAVAKRPGLQSLDASRCRGLHEDRALAQLSEVLRCRGGKKRPWLRPEEATLRHLRLADAEGLTGASCKVLSRLGLRLWVFPAPPARGAVLLSRPLFPAAEQPEMLRSVILLLEHGSRSVGLILNKPSPLELESLLQPLPPELGQSVVHFGGARGESLALVHGEEELGGDQLAPGIFVSSDPKILSQAADLVRWKRLGAEKLHWVFGRCSWYPGELDDAVKQGYFKSAFCDGEFLRPPFSPELWAELSVLL